MLLCQFAGSRPKLLAKSDSGKCHGPGSTIRWMRHMTATPERGPIVLIYGCSECNWIYRPQTPEEASEKYLLIAQFNFEQHDCSKYAAGS